MRGNYLFIAILAIFLMHGVAGPAAAADDGYLSLAATQWILAYQDSQLGEVTGWAYINEDATSAEVVLIHPKLKTRFELRSSSLLRSGDTVSMVLQGSSPAAGKVIEPNPANLKILRVPERLPSANIRADEENKRVPIKPRAKLDRDRVDLHLLLDAGGDMAGTWSYPADPVTQRDGAGGGRVGTFQMLEDEQSVGLQSGFESWQRLKPQIFDVIDLTEASHEIPNQPFPFNADAPSGSDSRRLFVGGINLPVTVSAPFKLVSEDSAVSYDLIYRPDQIGSSPAAEDQFELGRQLLEKKWGSQTSAQEREKLRGMDALILSAHLSGQIIPGIKSFTLNGAPANWLLRFDNNAAAVSFFRNFYSFADEAYSEQGEPISEVLIPERIRIKVQTILAIPGLKEIDLILERNDETLEFNGSRVLKAARAAGKIYQTDPIEFVSRISDREENKTDIVRLAVNPGDVLKAKLQNRSYIFNRVEPENATLSVLESADSLWEDALKRAAACIKPPMEIRENWREVANEKVLDISNLIITPEFSRNISTLMDTSLQRRNTTITVGDHAAMLMLLDEFKTMIAQFRNSDPTLAIRIEDKTDLKRNIYDPDTFRRDFRARAVNQNDPFGRIMVNAPSLPIEAINDLDLTIPPLAALPGWITTKISAPQVPYLFAFTTTYDDPWFKLHFGEDTTAAKRWADRALGEGLAQYRQSIIAAAGQAAATDPCKIEELLKIVGLGFEQVVQSLVPKLMKLEDAGSSGRIWVPDWDAKAAVLNLNILAQAIQAQQELSKIDTQVVIASAALAASLPALVTAAAWASVAAVAAEVGAAAVEVPRVWSDYWKSQRELAFARGASAVLGPDRLARAEAEAVELWQALLETGLAALGTSAEIGEAISRVRRAKGARAWLRLKDEGLEALDSMTPSEISNLRRFLDSAADLDPARLTRAQQDAMAYLNALSPGELDAISSRIAGKLSPTDPASVSKLMCFPAGTPVLTDKGLRPIEDLRPGDRVRSRNPVSLQEAYRDVLRTYTTHPAALYHIYYQTGGGAYHNRYATAKEDTGSRASEIVTTGEHPFWVIDRKDFVPARLLSVGDELISAFNGRAVVTDIRWEKPPPDRLSTAYNLDIEIDDTYFAGDDALWVHNQGEGCSAIDAQYRILLDQGLSSQEAFEKLQRLMPNAGEETMALVRKRVAMTDPVDEMRRLVIQHGKNPDEVARILSTRIADNAAQERLAAEARLLKEFMEGQPLINNLRDAIGRPVETNIKGMRSTVALVNLDGQAHYGFNSRFLAEEITGETRIKDLLEAYKTEIEAMRRRGVSIEGLRKDELGALLMDQQLRKAGELIGDQAELAELDTLRNDYFKKWKTRGSGPMGEIARTKKSVGQIRAMQHAEATALLRAHSVRGSLPERVLMNVDQTPCGHCLGTLPAIAEELGVKELLIQVQDGSVVRIYGGKHKIYKGADAANALIGFRGM
jgi:hypothetical protein